MQRDDEHSPPPLEETDTPSPAETDAPTDDPPHPVGEWPHVLDALGDR